MDTLQIIATVAFAGIGISVLFYKCRQMNRNVEEKPLSMAKSPSMEELNAEDPTSNSI